MSNVTNTSRFNELDEEMGELGERADNLETAVSALGSWLCDAGDVDWGDIEQKLDRIDFDKALRKAEKLLADVRSEMSEVQREMDSLSND